LTGFKTTKFISGDLAPTNSNDINIEWESLEPKNVTENVQKIQALFPKNLSLTHIKIKK